MNLSGIVPAKCSRSGPNSVYVDMSWGDNVQVILSTIGPFWTKWGLGRVPQSTSFIFLCAKPDNLSGTSQQPISTTFGHKTYFCVPSWNPKTFSKNFNLGSFEIEKRSNRHLTQSRLQVTGCTAERYCLLHVVLHGAGSFRGWSTFLYDVLLPNFRILAYFLPFTH